MRKGRRPLKRARTPDTANVGWRLSQLWKRRGLRQIDIARLTGLDAAYVSRMESGLLSKVREENADRILDAIGATHTERNAVYHKEEPPPTPDEIAEAVAEIAAHYEEDDKPIALLDWR